ncbi:hypothetical protein OG572_40100 [Streptomyces virginiae]|uniref:Uncharacterized protein n=1 Tax=Streptomyces virginiae TaxID=1961 RepID=A0ABZ1TMW3_STRVG|nr:hypothetical protein [Streptomyces virginiae]WTB27219.1 hypothetical protein OG253_40395 [Streptomyces virginiae]
MTLVVLIVLFDTASIANRTDRTRPENPGDQAIPRDHGYGPQGGQGRGGAHAATLDLGFYRFVGTVIALCGIVLTLGGLLESL